MCGRLHEAPVLSEGGGATLEAETSELALHDWLKSGEKLCDLANKLKPGSVAKIQSSAKPFSQRENIAAYLDACKSLGVPQFDLFVTVDLYERRNMKAVVRNLHSLGRVAQTIYGFEGPHLGAKLAKKSERKFTEAQLAEARGLPSRWTNRGNTVGGK